MLRAAMLLAILALGCHAPAYRPLPAGPPGPVEVPVAAPASAQQLGESTAVPFQLEAGDTHMCVVGSAGRVWCWGENEHGQLGDGTTEQRLTAVEVKGITDAVKVKLGEVQSCVLRRNGRVSCWGQGDGYETSEPMLMNDLTAVTQLDADGGQVCAVDSDGRVTCLGANTRFNGTPEGLPPVVQVAVGVAHTCARSRDGAAWCWGHDFARLFELQPVEMPGLADLVDLAVSGNHTCGVRRSGEVVCSGLNREGQCGDSTKEDRNGLIPIPIPKVSRVVLGASTSCGLTSDGEAWCWGESYGAVPRRIGSGLVALALGRGYACAAGADRVVRCWGLNWRGQMGNGARGLGRSAVPVEVKGLTDAAELVAGQGYTCARRQSGAVVCWGGGTKGELGNGVREDESAPSAVSGLDDAERLFQGSRTCAQRRNQRIVCWGNNEQGALLASSQRIWDRPTPMPLGSDTVAIRTGSKHSCALTAAGRVLCWGNNQAGELGRSTPAMVPRPINIPELGGSKLLAVAVGGNVTGGGGCVVRQSGQMACWGKLPDWDLAARLPGAARPYQARVVAGLPDPVEIAVAGGLIYARLPSGEVVCRIVQPNGVEQRDQVLLRDAVELGAGEDLGCARRTSGDVVCWSVGFSQGGLGPGTVVRVPGLSDAVEIAVGSDHACARRTTGQVVCWGEGNDGQLGIGDPVRYELPGVEVLGLEGLRRRPVTKPAGDRGTQPKSSVAPAASGRP